MDSMVTSKLNLINKLYRKIAFRTYASEFFFRENDTSDLPTHVTKQKRRKNTFVERRIIRIFILYTLYNIHVHSRTQTRGRGSSVTRRALDSLRYRSLSLLLFSPDPLNKEYTPGSRLLRPSFFRRPLPSHTSPSTHALPLPTPSL